MAAGGQGTYIATARRQPGGSVAGVYFVLNEPAGISITITTFLSETQQETGTSSRVGVSDTCNGQCQWNDGGPSFVGLDTTKDYDSIHAEITNSSGQPQQINELCVR